MNSKRRRSLIVSNEDLPTAKRSWLKLQIALLPGLFWLGALLWLTLTYANPVTLNRLQIFESDFIAKGRFAADLRELQVEETWPLVSGSNSLLIENATGLNIKPDQELLVPIFQLDGKLYITPSRMKLKPLVYLATDEAITQLKGILESPVKPRNEDFIEHVIRFGKPPLPKRRAPRD